MTKRRKTQASAPEPYSEAFVQAEQDRWDAVVNEIDKRLARGEAAEAQVIELRRELAKTQARVAELEEERRWQSPDEPPDDKGTYEIVVRAEYYPEFEGTWYIDAGKTACLADSIVLKWREPLPPLPAEATP